MLGGGKWGQKLGPDRSRRGDDDWPGWWWQRYERWPGFNPWVKKIPSRRAWQPTPVLLSEESCGQRNLLGTVHGVTKSQTQLSDFHLRNKIKNCMFILRVVICPWKKKRQRYLWYTKQNCFTAPMAAATHIWYLFFSKIQLKYSSIWRISGFQYKNGSHL